MPTNYTHPTRSQLLESLSNREKLLKKFKDNWYDEYLFSLREACTELHEMDYRYKIYVDEVVLIKNPMKPWQFWQLGRVVELHSRGDQKVRSVDIRKGEGPV